LMVEKNGFDSSIREMGVKKKKAGCENCVKLLCKLIGFRSFSVRNGYTKTL
jgi:hypothetical protein